MTQTLALSDKAEELIPLLDSLSATDRLGLAQYLELSVEGEAQPGTDDDIRAEWAAEIMRRIWEVENGEDDGMPSEEVHRLIRESLS